jgi:hypothetical protein
MCHEYLDLIRAWIRIEGKVSCERTSEFGEPSTASRVDCGEGEGGGGFSFFSFSKESAYVPELMNVGFSMYHAIIDNALQQPLQGGLAIGECGRRGWQGRAMT